MKLNPPWLHEEIVDLQVIPFGANVLRDLKSITLSLAMHGMSRLRLVIAIVVMLPESRHVGFLLLYLENACLRYEYICKLHVYQVENIVTLIKYHVAK